MGVLVDTSVWIDYFKGGDDSTGLGALIDENLVVTNDIILAELVPYLKVKKQVVVIKLLQEINRLPMQIDWDEIVAFQIRCLKAGANGVGIPDLIIAQNAKANNCKIYSLDKHFRLLKQVIKVKLY
ncbi:MAG: PIN domain-containing protein [Gammaproteobacteria bacterium]|nr:PIN domain-containing protein [Gammaproteobacteria bacterium]